MKQRCIEMYLFFHMFNCLVHFFPFIVFWWSFCSYKNTSICLGPNNQLVQISKAPLIHQSSILISLCRSNLRIKCSTDETLKNNIDSTSLKQPPDYLHSQFCACKKVQICTDIEQYSMQMRATSNYARCMHNSNFHISMQSCGRCRLDPILWSQ